MPSWPYPRRPEPLYTTRPGAEASTGSPSLAEMSTPLLPGSENLATILPLTGHDQSTFSSSSPRARGPGAGGGTSGFAAGAGASGIGFAPGPGLGVASGV